MVHKERITEIESLRGLAFLAVALQHSIAHYSVVAGIRLEDGVLMTLLLIAAKFAVPVFIFITGMVLFYNYEGQFNYFSFLRKRLSDIIIPYVLWSLVYFSLNYGWNEGLIQQGWKWLLMLFTGKTSYHLWYVVMIFQFYLLFPAFRYVIYKVRKAIPPRTYIACIICTGLLFVWLTDNIFTIGDVITGIHLPVITPMFTKYVDRNFLFFFFYFVLGACAGLRPDLWREWICKGKWIYVSCFIVLFGYYTYIVIESFQTPSGIVINFNKVNLLRPLMVFFLVSSICVFYQLAMWLNERGGTRCNKIIVSIGKYSYGAYLAHAFMLRVSYTFDVQFFVYWPVFLRMLMSFVICVLFSYFLMMLLSRMPFGKWVGGVPQKRKKVVTTT
ncbi:acyltransferase [Paenibacillus macquariensis]|uniref:Peptidoglycan/LPS O-acetylase OafA/YrhL, contains acyltransferase and SGNH-hydrolase domains n=1 Tax=Paenibacillus macquariensis TaxID=948756 RepID=A0ABY1JZE0_9BACL|nr:acyltransferase [Paenibacillus macquariensis]MEC0091284.1 acyltransferase [Paenibacillus macquariensis]OAB37977.1 hypothetical protein PMSM_02215 [Paenibacillus macquariensis subsp. macquariensis]SIR03536.1 Peptidoglycan/LPS O-acetylase OafA/YrhL, contains acyltransferase and SGNH-hydrolase domains [Paenibacillus macquariensis]